MRVRTLVLLLLLPALAAPAEPFLPALGPERPVSDVVSGAATGEQHGPLVASNGELALAVWTDGRARVWEAYAARIDAAGRVLDPLGINLSPVDFASAHGVVWNGTHFAVAVTFGGTWWLVFVAPDGSIAGMRVLELSPRYLWGDAAGEGAGARMLFLTDDNETRAAVVDGGGDVVARDIALVQPGDARRAMIAGSRGSEFLVLLSIQVGREPFDTRAVAARISAAGEVLSTEDPKLVVPDDRRSALEGGPDGWLLATVDASAQLITVHTLNERGVAAGEPRHFPGDPEVWGEGDVSIARESGGYTLTWNTMLVNHRRSSTWALSLPDDGPPGEPRRLYDWAGEAYSIAIASSGGQRVAVTGVSLLGDFSTADIFAQNVSDALAATPPVLVANSPARQGSIELAAGANGYLAAWSELGADGVADVFVRRLLPDGTRQGEPAAVAHLGQRRDFPRVNVVSNGATYLVTWGDGIHVRGRRLDASSGVWIDAEPFLFAARDPIVLATDGTDAVAAWSRCGDRACIQARRIRLAGDPLADPVVTITGPEEPEGLALASNGAGYLLAWQEGNTDCLFCEEPIPAGIHAARLRSDGTQLDPVPLVLVGVEEKVQPEDATIAWNGGRYLVAWEVRGDVKGALVTPEGAVLERGRMLVESPDGWSVVRPRLIAHRDRFVLFTREISWFDPASSTVSRWTSVAFDAGASLSAVAALPRTPVMADGGRMMVLSAASSGHAMLVGYDRIPVERAGGVVRVFTRLFGSFGPRRRAVR